MSLPKFFNQRPAGDKEAYRKITDAFRRYRKGATVADIVAATALPLEKVRELAPLAADEFSARLEVTESSEIRYSFPRGFTSRYRGFAVSFKRFTEKFLNGFKIAASFLFKIWIMFMLVGYFAFFMLIALASLVLSVAGSSNSSSRSRNSGGGFYLASSIFNLIIRLWFYSELTKSVDRAFYDGSYPQKQKPKGKPLHRAIFSFVFGDGNPSANREEREQKAVIAYIQANRGVIGLPEFMLLTGAKPDRAEEEIMAYCSRYGGSPEVTEGGTIVYRFDELLKRQDLRDRSFGGSIPLRPLGIFSGNEKKMNTAFSLINGVNLLFGSYFFWNSLNTGAILTQAQLHASSYLYGFSYVLLKSFIADPLPLLTIVLGLVPIAFSFLFWLIPALRYLGLCRDNEEIKMENLRRLAYSRIWEQGKGIKESDIEAPSAGCKPKQFSKAREKIMKEMGAYSMPEISVEGKEAVYSFPDLEREKEELKKYRSALPARAPDLGKTIFDTEN
ncbi:MAG: hypothetical protein LBC57_09360 [Treponema sp.]|jgi:hypothetical protein|nr:hypothetical protein [Treponema sp.]